MFYVDEPDEGLARMIEDGPQHMCWQGDQDCAFYRNGPCTAVPCTCELMGDCKSCRPAGFDRLARDMRRVP